MSPLARHRMPLIRFLFIGSHVCSALLSDPASRRRRCASLSLHLHQVVKRTFTPKLPNMLGTRRYPPAEPGDTYFMFLSVATSSLETGSWEVGGAADVMYLYTALPNDLARHS